MRAQQVFLLVGLCSAWLLTGCSDTDTDTGSTELTDSSVSDAETSEDGVESESDSELTGCETDADCVAESSCFSVTCDEGECVSEIVAAVACDDGDACTTGDTCDEKGACVGGEALAVEQGPCETCFCDSQDGVVCQPAVTGAACDDGDCCTDGDACAACDPETDPDCGASGMQCVSGDPVGCDDGNGCTVNECSCDVEGEVVCSATNVANSLPCDYDPNDCTEGDYCSNGNCIVGLPQDPDDGNPCTEDYCQKGEIVHEALLAGQCDDGNECTEGDSCYLGNCKPGDAVECVVPPCATDGVCVKGEGCVVTWKDEGAVCDDGDLCTSLDACTAEQDCVGQQDTCDDGNVCSVDTCDGATGECTFEASSALEGFSCEPEGEFECLLGGYCLGTSCVPIGEESCDDNDPCTEDSCGGNGCVHEPSEELFGTPCTLDDVCVESAVCGPTGCEPDVLETCDDGVACTDDACVVGEGCVFTPTGEPVTCNQQNALDSDGCCCFAEDPTGYYKSGHVLDMGAVSAGTELEVCLTPGLTNGCSDTAYIDVSSDGVNWSPLTSYDTTSQSKPEGGWVPQCATAIADVDFQYIRGANEKCFVDFFKAEIPCNPCEDEALDCDDGNPCTVDSCDPDSGCVHQAQESPSCMVLHDGNNLVSFAVLPEAPTLAAVMGDAFSYLNFIFSEGEMTVNKEGAGVVGNVTLDRSEGYWLNVNLPAGMNEVAIPLAGTQTDGDMEYPQGLDGLTMLSFSCGEAVPLVEALLSFVGLGPFADQWVGEGVAAFQLDDGTWAGNLTAFEPNHGYEAEGLSDPFLFSFTCPDSDGVDPHTYGCTDPHATNVVSGADVDDGSCVYEVPEGWSTPEWSSTDKAQAFAFFHGLGLEAGDSVAAFIEGSCVGVGFPDGDFVTVPVMNGALVGGQPVTFQWYDASADAIADLNTSPEVSWSLNAQWWVGCLEAEASNFASWADYGTDTCVIE